MKKYARTGIIKMIMLIMVFAVMATVTHEDAYASKASVTGIKISKLTDKNVTLKKGATKKYAVVVSTKGKISKSFTIKSNNNKVVRAVKSGKNVKLTGLKKGTTTVTITSKANKKKKIVLKVTVGTPVNKIKISKTSTTVVKGTKFTLKASVSPIKASNKKIKWETSNKKIATVNSKGVVTAKAAGVVTITAKATDASGKSAKCKVKVLPPNSIKKLEVDNPLIVVELARAQVLNRNNFKIMYKDAGASNYVMQDNFLNVTTIDNKTYTITLARDLNPLGIDFKIYISGLQGVKGVVSKTTKVTKKMYSEEEYYQYYEYNNTELKSMTIYLPYTFSSRYVYSCTNLPESARIYKEDDRIRIYYYSNEYMVRKSQIKFTDDMGDVYDCTIYFAAYDENHISGGNKGFEDITNGTYQINIGLASRLYGGSGKYTYELVSIPKNSILEITKSGYLKGYLKGTGSFKIRYKVTDADNAEIFTYVDCIITLKKGVTVTGRITDASNNNMTEGRISFKKNNEAVSYYDNSHTIYDNGEYRISLEAGVYDVLYMVNKYVYYIPNVKLTKSFNVFNIKTDVYKVFIDTHEYESLSNWIDVDTGYSQYDDKILYLQKGKREFTSSAYTKDKVKVNLKLSLNVTKEMIVKPVLVKN